MPLYDAQSNTKLCYRKVNHFLKRSCCYTSIFGNQKHEQNYYTEKKFKERIQSVNVEIFFE